MTIQQFNSLSESDQHATIDFLQYKIKRCKEYLEDIEDERDKARELNHPHIDLNHIDRKEKRIIGNMEGYKTELDNFLNQ